MNYGTVEEIRIECLKLAIAAGYDGPHALPAAIKFYDFVFNGRSDHQPSKGTPDTGGNNTPDPE